MAEIHGHLSGLPFTRARIVVPHSGVWYAEIDLVDDAEVSGRAVLTYGAAKLHGTIDPLEGGVFALQRRVRLVAGGGGWSNSIRSRAYRNDAGVKAKDVATDAATAAGESLDSFDGGEARLGTHYMRETAAAGRTIADVARGSVWWVGYDGLTRVAKARDTSAPDPSSYHVVDYDPRERVALIASEDLEAVAIGARIVDERLSSAITIRALEVVIEPNETRILAWCADEGESSQLVDAFTALVRASIPTITGTFRYRVVAMNADGERVDLQAVGRSPGLPDLVAVPQWASPGVHARLKGSTHVAVTFLDGDRDAPIVIGWVGRGSAQHVPDGIDIGGEGGAPAARQGDTVKMLLPPMVFTGTIGGSPATGVVSALTPYTLGTIETGSAIVNIASGS